MATEIKSTSIKSQNIIAEPQANKPGSPEAGQIIQATGTGDIAKGIYHYTGESFFSLDNAQGDLETLRLVLSTDTSAVDFKSALNSTSTLAGNTNAVPHETSTGTGLLGALEIPSTGGDALLTEFDANKVFRYFSAGANNNNDYFGIPIDIPAQTRGQNIVIKFKYRTEEASATTSNGDFQVSVWDKTNGVKTTQDSTLTTGTTISAGSNILMTSKTNLSVGDKIWFETGGTGSTVGGVANSLTQAYITSISSTDNNITVSEDVQVIASGLAVTGWLSDKSTGLLPSADSDTNKVGKDFSIAVKTEEDTEQIVLYISNKSTTTNVIELFFDGILVSQNKFLQASSQTKNESYAVGYSADFWDTGTGTGGYLFDESMLLSHNGTPPLAQSNLITISDITGPGTTGTVTAIKAKQSISLTLTAGLDASATGEVRIYKNDGLLYGASGPDGTVSIEEASLGISLSKDEYVYVWARNPASRAGYLSILAQPQTSDVILLESQDEIFTDWIPYTPSFGGVTSTAANTKFAYRRVGSSMEIFGSFVSATVAASALYFTLPSGYQVDVSTFYPAGRTAIGVASREAAGIYSYEKGNTAVLFQEAGDVNLDRIYFHSLSTGAAFAAVNGNGFMGTSEAVSVRVWSVPIQGWNSNFNPLLSMPLVDIGSDCEYYNYRFLTNPVNTGTNKSYRLLANTSTGSEIENTISSLGTIDNSTTEGWSFQASQRVKVHFAVGFACSTTSAGVGIVKLPNAPSTYANEAWGHSQWNDLGVGGTQDTRTGAGYQGATSVSIIMEPGEYIQAIIDNTNVQNSAKSGFTLLVERDRSNTNMAHIIKPSVARITYETTRNTSPGGSTGSGAGFVVRPLTTLTGESYFVSIDTSTDTFTLDPGTYQIRWKANGFSTEAFQTRLELDSVAYKYGSLGYSVSTGQAGDVSYGDVVTTVTSSTQTWRLTHIQSHNNTTNGFGQSQNGWDAPQVHSEIVIEKLK